MAESTMVAVTVVTRDRLAAARVLARTYLAHHPGHDFIIVVADEQSANGENTVGYDWLEIDRDHYLRMATRLPAAQLVAAVIPRVLQQVLAYTDTAIYLDPETQVLASFAGDVAALAADRDIVLAPYSLAPRQHEEASAFAPGFVGTGQGAKPFLDFWAEAERRRFDLVPGLFRHEVVRDPGLAVGYWNLPERRLATGPDGAATAAGAPIRFMHFTGYRPATPWLLSTDRATSPQVRISEDPLLRQLCDSYRDLLLAEDARPAGYGFDQMPDGSPVTGQMRELFRTASADADEPLHPFGPDHGRAFRQWLGSAGSPREHQAGLSRLAMQVWTDRPDLQVAFRQPFDQDAVGFRQWCATHGADEGLVPQWALPAAPPPVEPPVTEFGVNVAGYLTAVLGLGEQGRLVHRAVQHAKIPLVSVTETQSVRCETGLDEPETAGTARFPLSILSVNADFTKLLLDSHPALGHQRYKIGLWAWELEEFPAQLHGAFALVDEVWTVSEFVKRAIAPHSPVPVKAVPMPVADPGAIPRRRRQAGDSTQFLFAFDYNSTAQRKNPWGLVTAFQRAFPGRDDVRLVIKTTNADTNVSAVERLHYVIGGDRRIELLDRYLSVDELNDLYARSDAYVSLHRSEGFGLTVAEAMVRSMPVIATDYSGTTEFFDATVGWPIPYELTEVEPGWPPYQPGAMWADPDLDAAANTMRTVADDPDEAARRGAAAREHILRTRSMDRTADWIRAELMNAFRTWQARDDQRRRPLAPALRRIVRRAITKQRTSDGNRAAT